MDEFIRASIATVDHVAAKRGSRKQVDLAFDEWNVWYQHDFVGHTNLDLQHALIEDTFSVADAVLVGSFLNAFLRHADRVKIACQAQLVNVIGLIRTEAGSAWRQSIFHPFAQTARLARGTALRVEPEAPRTRPPSTARSTRSTSRPPGTRTAVPSPSSSSTDIRATPSTSPWTWAAPGAQVVECLRLDDDDPRHTNTPEQPEAVQPRPDPTVRVEGVPRSAADPRVLDRGRPHRPPSVNVAPTRGGPKTLTTRPRTDARSPSKEHQPCPTTPPTATSPSPLPRVLRSRGRQRRPRRLLGLEHPPGAAPSSGAFGKGHLHRPKVALAFWNGFTGGDGPFMKQMVEEFNKANPNVTVSMNTSSGPTTTPRCRMPSPRVPAPTSASCTSTSSPPTPHAGSSCRSTRSPRAGARGGRLRAVVWGAGIYQDKRYGIPLDIHLGFYANTAHLEKAGIDGLPKDRAEFEAAVKAIQDKSAARRPSGSPPPGPPT